jgi:hypothetical protein
MLDTELDITPLVVTTEPIDYLPRFARIDWLRFQFESYSPWLCAEIQQLIDLPFQCLPSDSNDKNSPFRFLNKIWDNIFEFQASRIGIKKPTIEGEAYRYFVDLNGKTLASLPSNVVVDLLAYCQKEVSFIGNRIDVALDFPISSPRLFYRPWEEFINDHLIFGYRSIKRISNIVNNHDESTVYLGSRESEKFVRIYPKKIDEENFDRLEVEFKRGMAQWVMEGLTELNTLAAIAKFLNGVVIKQVEFVVFDSRTAFFKAYQLGAIYVPPTKQHLDIERSIAFIERHSATFAMIREYMGVSEFDSFMSNLLVTGKNRMKFRHHSILKNAKLLGSTAALFLLFFMSHPSAIAGGLTCPAPVPLSFQFSQKFPIDIVNPTAAEQAYFDNIGDGCFEINSGLEFDRICLPGMIVNALRPFVIMGLGLRFIFSD